MSWSPFIMLLSVAHTESARDSSVKNAKREHEREVQTLPAVTGASCMKLCVDSQLKLCVQKYAL